MASLKAKNGMQNYLSLEKYHHCSTCLITLMLSCPTKCLNIPHSQLALQIYSGKFPYDFVYGDENNRLETFRTQRDPTRYRIDASYDFRKEFKHAKFFLRFGLYNILGNPSKDELSFNFSYKLNGGCIPFGAITYKF